METFLLFLCVNTSSIVSHVLIKLLKLCSFISVQESVYYALWKFPGFSHHGTKLEVGGTNICLIRLKSFCAIIISKLIWWWNIGFISFNLLLIARFFQMLILSKWIKCLIYRDENEEVSHFCLVNIVLTLCNLWFYYRERGHVRGTLLAFLSQVLLNGY